MFNNYKAPTGEVWKGRVDSAKAERYHQNIKICDLNKNLDQLQAPGIAILGFVCDEGVKRNQGRPGAKEGPMAFRNALCNMPAHFKKGLNIYDCGDIVCDDEDLESAQAALGAVTAALLERKILPFVIGGGHEVAWGQYQGIAAAYSDVSCGIVNFDAHYDLRPLLSGDKGSSGTSFLQIANALKNGKKFFDYTCIGVQRFGNTPSLQEQADSLGVQTITAEEIHLNGSQEAQKILRGVIKSHEALYVTICLDVFASPYAPGVSAPQPLGLTPWQVIPLLLEVAASGKVVGFNIAELAPCRDQDGVTAKLAAHLFCEFASCIIASL